MSRRIVLALLVLSPITVLIDGGWPAAARANETVLVCDVYGDSVAPQPPGAAGIGARAACPGDPTAAKGWPPGGMALWTASGGSVPRGTAAHWNVTAPAGMTIDSVYIPHMYSEGIDDGGGWGGGFFWSGGSNNVNTFDGETGWSSSTTSGPAFTWPGGGTPYFGWQVVCGASPCTAAQQWISVELLELNVQETSGPYLTAPDGLWASSGWIRGTWPLHYYGDSPSGLCTLNATLNGQSIPGASVGGNPRVWHQCSSPAVDENVNTSQYGQGALSLVLGAIDAAHEPVFYPRTVDVDNQTPTISLSGPTDALSTSGTQYVTASAGAGPSGVSGISCSVDNAPPQWYPSSSAQVPVSGVGPHQVSCYSKNNARDTSGAPASSSVATWNLSIRVPTLVSTAFAKLRNPPKCVHVTKRIRVPGRWVKIRRHHRIVRVHRRAHTKKVHVVRCHIRVVVRRVRVHGHWRRIRIPLIPRVVYKTVQRTGYGHTTTVGGWLGQIDGTALGGAAVAVLTAPANGSNQFTQIGTATTAPNGTWSATLPPGPSRLVAAGYGGSPTTEPSGSADAVVLVPAKLRLNVKPTHVSWGGRIVISGRLLGGYIPVGRASVSQLLRLRIGLQHVSQTAGIPNVAANGRFRTSYCFNPGHGVVRFWFSVSTLNETDYPYAPHTSRRVDVAVGPGNARRPCR